MKHDLLAMAVFAAFACAATPAIAQDNTATTSTSTQKLETIEVTGSRIPRAQIEGPSPITIISDKDIRERGFATAADIACFPLCKP